MNTDAPPEKMMLEPCHCGAGHPFLQHEGNMRRLACPRCGSSTPWRLDEAGSPEIWNNAMKVVEEAARRLSAPAGKVVDNCPTCGTPNVAIAPTPAAPRVGDGPPREPTGKMWSDGRRAFLSQAEKHHQANTSKVADAYADVSPAWAALSAPPAASADEREELIRAIAAWAVGFLDPIQMSSLASDLLAAGYRKLAPAQSVGQSAAQGVAWQTVARAICAETCAFKGEPACYEVTGNMGKPLPWPAPACDEPGCEWLAKRVLSALPKGQEHE